MIEGKVDVMVNTYNSERHLDACLKSVVKNIPVKTLWVIDKNSKDGTVEIAEKYGAKIIQSNVGILEARALGFRLVETDLFVNVDSDVILPDNWFSEMMQYWEPDLGCLWGITIEQQPLHKAYIESMYKFRESTSYQVTHLPNMIARKDILKDIYIPRELKFKSFGNDDAWILHWMKDVKKARVKNSPVRCKHYSYGGMLGTKTFWFGAGCRLTHLTKFRSILLRFALAFLQGVFVLLIISASLFLLVNRSGSGSNVVPPDVTWSNVLGDSSFAGGSCWMVDTWNQGSSTHNYSLGGGLAYTGLCMEGFDCWGNTEFEQGVDPWGSYGQPLPSVDLTVPQRLVANCCVVESSGNPVCGRVNLYVEFWLRHPDGDGVKGYRWAEAMIVFDSEGLLMPCNAGENSYWAKYPVEGDWYFVGYRHSNVGDDWTYRETDLNSVFGLLESKFGCSLDEWVVSCVCFGVEGTSGSLAAEWSLVQWDVEA